MQETMRATHGALAFVTLLAIGGCKGPHEQPIPPDLKSIADDKSFQAAIQKLPEDERVLFARYMMRTQFAKAFTGETGNAKTVGEAISDQKKFLETEKASEAEGKALAEKAASERAGVMKAMGDVLTVALTDKTVYPADPQAGRYLSQNVITVTYQNKSTMNLIGVKGTLICNDIFGDEITSFGVKVDEPMVAGQTYVWHHGKYLIDTLAADTKFANTPLDKIKAIWEPDTYLFKDGTSLTAPKRPADGFRF